ncbi:hypothetical protein E3N88_00839 [Mikania micrantha]|uniref:Uncharacterized protein n=1 Tax=Mikania micrantha TaxID=192012 RepID=A0A5N6PZZ9_9ASTR|nr:hypothetical protein E3N88_00839 [Mikania micrantha]
MESARHKNLGLELQSDSIHPSLNDYVANNVSHSPFIDSIGSGFGYSDGLSGVGQPRSNFTFISCPSTKGFQSREEMSLGTMFQWGQQVGMTHKGPEGKLWVLLIGNDHCGNEEGEQLLWEADNSPN